MHFHIHNLLDIYLTPNQWTKMSDFQPLVMSVPALTPLETAINTSMYKTHESCFVDVHALESGLNVSLLIKPSNKCMGRSLQRKQSSKKITQNNPLINNPPPLPREYTIYILLTFSPHFHFQNNMQ